MVHPMRTCKRSRWIATCFLIFVTVGTARGNIYVVSPTGNDAGQGTTNDPWRTLQRAADAAAAGDSVLVQPGS